MSTEAGELITLLLKPLSKQPSDPSTPRDHVEELRATAANDKHYSEGKGYLKRAKIDKRDEEYYDLCFAFPAHDTELNMISNQPDPYMEVKAIYRLLNQFCTYRASGHGGNSRPRSEYSVTFHEPPRSLPSYLDKLKNLIRQASQLSERRPVAPQVLELARQETTAPLLESEPGIDELSEFYDLQSLFTLVSPSSVWRHSDVRLLLRNVFVDCMQRLGANTSTSIHKTKVFVKMRLTEMALRQVADRMQYPLHVAHPSPAAAVVCPFSHSLPYSHWQRYDGLSREIKDPDHNALGSIFRDLDRIRLLLLQIQAHFNLSVMQTPFMVAANHQLQPPLLEYFPLHRIHMQQYFLQTAGSLLMKPANRGDEIYRARYFGEEVGGFFIWTRLLLWGVAGPAVYGLILSGMSFLVVFIQPTHVGTLLLLRLRILTKVMSLFYVLYLTVWIELFAAAWRRRSRILRESGITSVTSPATPQTTGTGPTVIDVINPMATDFERPDYQFDFYRSLSDGTYVKRELPQIRSRQRILARLLTLWLYLSLTLCLLLTFYLRAIAPAPTPPEMRGDETAFQVIRSFVIPMLSPLQLLNYLQSSIVLIFDRLWNITITFILALENHRYEAHYRRSLVHKSACFKFINHFLPLLYAAFLSGESHLAFQNQLLVQVLSLVGNDFIEILRSVFSQLRKWREEIPTASRSLIVQSDQPQYRLDQLAQDYIDKMLQLTHVLLLAPICPIIPLFAGIRCLLQLWTQNYKLAILFKRIVTHSYPASFEPIIWILSYVSTPVSLALLMYSESQVTTKVKLIAFLGLENLMVLAKILARYIAEPTRG